MWKGKLCTGCFDSTPKSTAPPRAFPLRAEIRGKAPTRAFPKRFAFKVRAGEADWVSRDRSHPLTTCRAPAESRSSCLITCLIPEPFPRSPLRCANSPPGAADTQLGGRPGRGAAPQPPLEIHILGPCSHFLASARKVFLYFFIKGGQKRTPSSYFLIYYVLPCRARDLVWIW